MLLPYPSLFPPSAPSLRIPQSEWTTSSRKGKKKSQSEPELIVAPGDQKTRGGPKTGRGTSKAGERPYLTHTQHSSHPLFHLPSFLPAPLTTSLSLLSVIPSPLSTFLSSSCLTSLPAVRHPLSTLYLSLVFLPSPPLQLRRQSGRATGAVCR